jgi:hypothetical protein
MLIISISLVQENPVRSPWIARAIRGKASIESLSLDALIKNRKKDLTLI